MHLSLTSLLYGSFKLQLPVTRPSFCSYGSSKLQLAVSRHSYLNDAKTTKQLVGSHRIDGGSNLTQVSLVTVKYFFYSSIDKVTELLV